MEFDANPAALRVIDSYPPRVRQQVLRIRKMIIAIAEGLPEVSRLEETLKWGEPSYLTKTGTTVRVAWSPKKPEHYGVYVHCGTTLIETFRELYSDLLEFEGSRAITFQKNAKLPVKPLRHCIELALTYHVRKRNS